MILLKLVPLKDFSKHLFPSRIFLKKWFPAAFFSKNWFSCRKLRPGVSWRQSSRFPSQFPVFQNIPAKEFFTLHFCFERFAESFFLNPQFSSQFLVCPKYSCQWTFPMGLTLYKYKYIFAFNSLQNHSFNFPIQLVPRPSSIILKM